MEIYKTFETFEICIFFLTLMGYNYSYLLENEHEKKLTESLFSVLKRDNCASLSRLVNFLDRGRFRIICLEDDEKTLRYVNENDETIFMSFPAVLNMRGVYSDIHYSVSDGNGESVSFFCLIYERNFNFFQR